VTDEVDLSWRILLVEDDEEIARLTVDSIQRRAVSTAGEHARVDHVARFEDALTRIENRRYDAIILDIRDQDEAETEAVLGADNSVGDESLPADKGLSLYSEIRKRRFLPIVFYSALANLAADQHQPPFVTVVSKLSGSAVLRQSIIEVFDSGLPSLNRDIGHHVNAVFRDFMIKFVEKRWSALSGPEHRSDLAYLMVRRLARSLDSTFIPNMAGAEVALEATAVHPTRLYIMPPLEERRTGDLVCDGNGNWFFLLTPTCDLVLRNGEPKAENVLLAECQLLSETDEYQAWHKSGQEEITKRLEKVINNNRQGQQDRLYFLPAAWGMPDLIIDLQRLRSIEFNELIALKHVATVDDPYAQSIIAQFIRYAGRIGTPDLDVSSVKERLQHEHQKDDS
jgi:CheY-like chemotaxis protein